MAAMDLEAAEPLMIVAGAAAEELQDTAATEAAEEEASMANFLLLLVRAAAEEEELASLVAIQTADTAAGAAVSEYWDKDQTELRSPPAAV